MWSASLSNLSGVELNGNLGRVCFPGWRDPLKSHLPTLLYKCQPHKHIFLHLRLFDYVNDDWPWSKFLEWMFIFGITSKLFYYLSIFYLEMKFTYLWCNGETINYYKLFLKVIFLYYCHDIAHIWSVSTH